MAPAGGIRDPLGTCSSFCYKRGRVCEGRQGEGTVPIQTYLNPWNLTLFKNVLLVCIVHQGKQFQF